MTIHQYKITDKNSCRDVNNETFIFTEELKKENSHPHLFLFSYAYLNKGTPVIFSVGQSDTVILLELEFEDFLINWAETFFNKNQNLRVSWILLQIAGLMQINEDTLFKLYPVIQWPGYHKGVKSFNLLKDSSPLIKELIFNKKIGLPDALFVHETFQSGYDPLIGLLTSHLSFSQMNLVSRYVCEYTRKNQVKIETIVDRFQQTPPEDWINLARTLKFPGLTLAEEKINQYIRKYQYPSGVRYVQDEYFEKNHHELQILFKNRDDLKLKLMNILKKTDKMIEDGEPDFFNFDLLFEKANHEKKID